MHRPIYDSSVSEPEFSPNLSIGEREELRREIERLQAELSRYRETEQLLVKTLASATNHAIAIRESARREAELVLRKARAEAQTREAAAERKKNGAERELLRLRRLTEQMRRGLSGFLTAKLEELQVDSEPSESVEPDAELEAGLVSGLEGELKRVATPEAGPYDHAPGGGSTDDRR
jgi:cell division initiation protein